MSKTSSIKRQIHGTAVRFYKRTENSNYSMDFEVMGERVQESTGWPTMADAERAADKRVREVKERKQGLAAAGQGHQKAKGKYATVGDVIKALDGGAKVWGSETLMVYTCSLKRLAKVVDAREPLNAGLDVVLSDQTIERFYARGQGLPGVNWADSRPGNGGLNTCIRNVKAIFTPRVVKIKFGNLKLPDLRELRSAPFLRHRSKGFVPWPVGVYEAMHEASEKLRTSDPELWLVNAMLRRLGLRDGELLAARRDWIEVQSVPAGDEMGPPLMRAWLVVHDRDAQEADEDEDVEEVDGFEVLKHGKPRKLELDAELMSLLLPREGHLIGDGWTPHARYTFLYRAHNQWVRKFIPKRKKANHELRMYAGSLVYMRDGLEEAAAFLGHKSTTTTERYYAAFLSTSKGLSSSEVSGETMARLRMAA